MQHAEALHIHERKGFVLFIVAMVARTTESTYADPWEYVGGGMAECQACSMPETTQAV